VLVHELVVKGADQHQVREIRGAASPPPHDVMGLREPPGPTPGKPALPVPIVELAQHGRGRLPRDPPEGEGLAGLVLDHRLDPSVAGEASDGLGMCHPALLE